MFSFSKNGGMQEQFQEPHWSCDIYELLRGREGEGHSVETRLWSKAQSGKLPRYVVRTEVLPLRHINMRKYLFSKVMGDSGWKRTGGCNCHNPLMFHQIFCPR